MGPIGCLSHPDVRLILSRHNKNTTYAPYSISRGVCQRNCESGPIEWNHHHRLNTPRKPSTECKGESWSHYVILMPLSACLKNPPWVNRTANRFRAAYISGHWAGLIGISGKWMQVNRSRTGKYWAHSNYIPASPKSSYSSKHCSNRSRKRFYCLIIPRCNRTDCSKDCSVTGGN